VAGRAHHRLGDRGSRGHRRLAALRVPAAVRRPGSVLFFPGFFLFGVRRLRLVTALPRDFDAFVLPLVTMVEKRKFHAG
jgi:hypothetical protein